MDSYKSSRAVAYWKWAQASVVTVQTVSDALVFLFFTLYLTEMQNKFSTFINQN